MSHHLESDERGIILPCPACGTANRIAYARVAQQGRCGTCKADLPLIAEPVGRVSPVEPLPPMVALTGPVQVVVLAAPLRLIVGE